MSAAFYPDAAIKEICAAPMCTLAAVLPPADLPRKSINCSLSISRKIISDHLVRGEVHQLGMNGEEFHKFVY